jgi:putative ABC transport system ATP-binding protein
VMMIFSRLNADGRTIILITHEEEIASFAKRTVRLRDGLVVDDRRRTAVKAAPPGLAREHPVGAAAGTAR